MSDNEYIRWTNYEKINKGSCLPFSENLFLAGGIFINIGLTAIL